MNNLKKFSTEADYSAATLNYPAVSWVTSGDTVHFDKSGSTPTVNDKVMMAWHNGEHSAGDIALVNLGSTDPTDVFNTLTLNDVDVLPLVKNDGVLVNYGQANTDYLAKYGLKEDSTISDKFSGGLGGSWGSDTPMVDFLIPAQVTSILSLPDDTYNLVIEATTPPTTSVNWSSIGSLTLYVPTESVTAYQTAYSDLLDVGGSILPISQYSGNLPV